MCVGSGESADCVAVGARTICVGALAGSRSPPQAAIANAVIAPSSDQVNIDLCSFIRGLMVVLHGTWKYGVDRAGFVVPSDICTAFMARLDSVKSTEWVVYVGRVPYPTSPPKVPPRWSGQWR